jgi:outer membrane protein assembly factor BamB
MSRRRIVVVSIAALVAAVGVVYYWERTHAKGGLVALDLRTGAIRWRASVPTGSAHVHAIGGSQVVVSGADSCSPPGGETIVSYALADGTRRWSEPWKGVCFDYGSSMRVTDGLFAIDGRHGPVLVRARDGSTARRLVAPSGALATASGVVTLDGDDVAAEPLSGGAPTWTAHVAGRPELLSADEHAVLLIGDPTRLTALDRRTGAHLWKRELPFVGGYGGPVRATDGVVAIWGPVGTGASGRYETDAIDEQTGRILWRRRSALDAQTGVLAVGGDLALYAGRSSGGLQTVFAVDLRSGRTRWAVHPADLSGPPVAAAVGNGVTVVTDGHRVEALADADGASLWSRRWPSGTPGAGRPEIAGGLVLVPYTRSGFPSYEE